MALTMTVTIPTTAFGSEEEQGDSENIPVEKQAQEITFNEDIEATIAEGEAITVVYGGSVDLGAAAAGTLHFDTSDESVLSVSDEGVVKGEGVGQATIEVTAEETETYNAATPRVVAFEVVQAEQTITINNEVIPAVMAYHDTFELDVQAEGVLSYTTSDDTVLSVTDEGVIKAEGIGKEKITVNAAATDNYQEAEPFEIEIEVVKADQEIVLDEVIESELADNDNTISVEKGKKRSLNAEARSIVVDEATNCEIIYDINSPDNKVSIDDTGELSAESSEGIKDATVTMYAKAEGGYNKSALREINVVVIDELDGILPASEFVESGIDGFYARVITVIRTLTDGEWSKYQEATNELIGGIENLGDKIINGEIEVVSGYKFVKKEQTISVEQNELTVALGKTEQIKASAETAVTFTPSDETVISVDDEGVITPITVGSAVVTITADADSKYKAADPVKVNVKVIEVRPQTVNAPSSISKTIGEGKFSLDATFEGDPENELQYKSSNVNVATVDANGNVTILATGSAKITVIAPKKGVYQEATKDVTLTVNGLAKPTLTVKAMKKRKIKLTWSVSTGAQTYQVYTYVNKKTTTMTGKWAAGNKRTITNTKLKKKKTYKYKVRAVTTVNGKTYYSPWSAVKKAKCKK